MTEDGWIAYRTAVAMTRDEAAVLRALMTGEIKSRAPRYERRAGGHSRRSLGRMDVPTGLQRSIV